MERQAATTDGQDGRELRAYFRALADSTRLRVLQYLWQNSDRTVTELCRELRVSQPLMSWHLRILRRAGLVTTRRSGREVHCAVGSDILGRHSELLSCYLDDRSPAHAIRAPGESDAAPTSQELRTLN